MKVLAFGIVLLLVAVAVESLSHHRPHLKLKKVQRIRHSPALKASVPVGRVGKFDFCKTCIEFTEEALNELLNIILNVGVVGTCATLCGDLENKTHSQPLAVVCNILCDVVGIKEFVSIIEKADLDPIYFCELTHSCKVNDNGDAKITSVTVTPAKGHKGGTFVIAMDYTSKNGTGTGEVVVEISTVDGLPIGDGEIVEPQEPGDYHVQWSLSTKNSGCDPSQGPCEQWLPGNYGVKTLVCNGECGSKHPHSKIYDEGYANFTLVEN